MLVILLQNTFNDNLGPIIFCCLILFFVLCFILTTYYDGFNDEPVKIKNRCLRLGNHYDKYVIEKFYFPGFWNKVINKPFVVPTYVTEITEDMENICNSKGEIISRTTVFPDTDDYELAKREFARIYAYTTRDKYKKYMLDKQYNKSKHNLASGLNETPTEEPETSKKVKRKNTK